MAAVRPVSFADVGVQELAGDAIDLGASAVIGGAGGDRRMVGAGFRDGDGGVPVEVVGEVAQGR